MDGTTIKVALPHAEILSINLIPEAVAVHERAVPLGGGCDNIEIEALNKAREQFGDETRQNPNALAIAERLAKEQLTEFLHQIGFSQVEITFK